jgi:hypothetical protein
MLKKLVTIPDDLSAFKRLEQLIAAFCTLIPLFLIAVDKFSPTKDSISAYAYVPDNRHVFGLVFSITAMMFIFNGVIYIANGNSPHGQDYRKGGMKSHGRWYNIFLGLALFGVALFPCKDEPNLHYFFAVLFFVGSAIVIAFFNDRRHRAISIVIAIASLFSYTIYYLTDLGLTLFWAEWISLIIIGIHYILESRGVITFTKFSENLKE